MDVKTNEFDVYMTPQQEKEYLEGKPVVIMKQLHNLYTKLYLEKHQARSAVQMVERLR